jgi:hypothetical protein
MIKSALNYIEKWNDITGKINSRLETNWNNSLGLLKVKMDINGISFQIKILGSSPDDFNKIWEYKDLSLDNLKTLRFNYRYSFMISQKLYNKFLEMLEEDLMGGFDLNGEFISHRLIDLEEHLKFIKSIKIGDVDFYDISYEFKSISVIDLLILVSHLSDTIEIISHWISISDDGEIIWNTDRQPNEIVSLDSDRTGDYFIRSIKFSKIGGNWEPRYILTKILSNGLGKQSFELGDDIICTGGNIIENRDWKISNLINKSND